MAAALSVAWIVLTGTWAWGESPTDPQAAAHFERAIRPALIESCLDCHSEETDASGGLVLDSREGWARGGALGPAIVPGRPDESLLMRAIGYDDPDLQMPPDGKLDDATIAAFRKWIEQGAFDPRVSEAAGASPSDAGPRGLTVEEAEQHWAYRPLAPVSPPEPLPGREGASPIDCFLDRKLAEEGLAAGPAAGKRELIRRLTFDLHGLPPTPEQIEAFRQDQSRDAYRRLVERLLASPHYAEHFARRWLDVARYAESITLRGFVLPEAWRYRDYVVAAYAADRPFDAMIRDQIAGDLIPQDDLRQRQLSATATGFLAMGNTNLEDQDKTNLDFDHIDEQLETVGRAFLGQTIGCARCHDHKFDPIPTKDYYALAGIFRSTKAMDHANVSKWIEQPLPLDASEAEKYRSWQQERDAVQKEIKSVKASLAELSSVAEGNVTVADLPGIVVDDEEAKYVGQWKVSQSVGGFIGDGYRHDNNQGQGEKTATFEPRTLAAGTYRVRLAYTSGQNRATNVRVEVFSANESKTVRVNQRRKPPEEGHWVSLGEFPFEDGGQGFVMVSNADADGHVIVDAVQFLPTSGEALPSRDQPSAEDDRQLARLQKRLEELTAREKQLTARLDERPRYLTIAEGEPVEELAIRIRGNVHSLGEQVPRGFLTAIGPAAEWAERIPSDRSGRVALANWIADPRNPLTARVYANRVWSWLMGDGLVSTENNFGTTGSEPSHPKLLDWLAGGLIRHGWSTRWLVRQIVMSDAYRRAVVSDEAAMAIDPSNRWYWSAPIRRLPVEALRDAMLCVSGELDRQVGGCEIRPGTHADYEYRHDTRRRSLYAPVFRNSLPPLYRVFDFADTSVSVGQRPRSTVATQSLALMNHRWVIERSQAAAERWLRQASGDGDNSVDAVQLVDQLYRSCFGRPPSPEEEQLSLDFLAGPTVTLTSTTSPRSRPGPSAEKAPMRLPADDATRERLRALIHSLFASVDFRFLD